MLYGRLGWTPQTFEAADCRDIMAALVGVGAQQEAAWGQTLMIVNHIRGLVSGKPITLAALYGKGAAPLSPEAVARMNEKLAQIKVVPAAAGDPGSPAHHPGGDQSQSGEAPMPDS